MCRMWVKIVYINPQGIASDRNPLVTCPDFDLWVWAIALHGRDTRPFNNEMITGVRGLVGPLLYMVELSKHHLNINAGQHEQSLINSINIILNIFKYTFN